MPNLIVKQFYGSFIDGWTDLVSSGKPLTNIISIQGPARVIVDGATFRVQRAVTTGGGLSLRFGDIPSGCTSPSIKLRRFSGDFDTTTSSGGGSRGGFRVEAGANYGFALIEDNDFRSPWRSASTIPDNFINQLSMVPLTVERNNRSSWDNGYVRESSSYVMSYQTRTVGVSSTASPLTITLPALNTIRGPLPGDPMLVYSVVDESGAAATNNITIACAGSDTLEGGATSTAISTNYGSFSAYSNGTTWVVAASGSSGGGGSLTLDSSIARVSTTATGSAGSVGKASDSGHYHPRFEWTAVDHGLLAWAFDAALVSGSNTALPTAGTMYLIKLHVPVASSVTNVIVYLNTLGSGLTTGQCFAALYQAGSLIGVSADQTSSWNTGGATGTKTIALSGGPFAVVAGDVYVALWFNGTTGPAFGRVTNVSVVNVGLASAHSRFAQANTGVTTTAPGTLSTASAVSIGYWAALS